jgi:hypothetical protein
MALKAFAKPVVAKAAAVRFKNYFIRLSHSSDSFAAAPLAVVGWPPLTWAIQGCFLLSVANRSLDLASRFLP